jgi:ribosomal protein S18 acetylase RimI-like enzyme
VNAYFWWIQSVYVAPGFRRQGVYSQLHRHVEKLAAGTEVCGIRLYVDRDNARARATYERLGMKPARYDLYETSDETRNKEE